MLLGKIGCVHSLLKYCHRHEHSLKRLVITSLYRRSQVLNEIVEAETGKKASRIGGILLFIFLLLLTILFRKEK